MHTNRRQFLKLAGTAAAVGCATQSPKTTRSGRPLPDTTSASDTASLDDTGVEIDTGDEPDLGPTLADPGLGLPDLVPGALTTSSYGDEDLTLEVLSGELPDDMDGYVWLVHPIPPGDGNPVFAGEGRIVRIALSSGAFEAKLRLARTPCHYADLASVGSSYGFNTSEMARMSLTLGVRNLANTAFVVLPDDRVLVTYDGGRPFELDPAEARIETAVGWNAEWTGAMPAWMDWLMPFPFPMVMSTAHPAVDEGELFTVEYNLAILGNAPWTKLVRWPGSGELETWTVVDEAGAPVVIEQSVHQMVATEQFIVIVDTAFVVEVEAMFGMGEMRAQSPETVVWIIDRGQLYGTAETVTAIRAQIPLEAVHFSCDYATPGGEITLHLAHTPGADASEFIEPGDTTSAGIGVRNDLQGLPAAPTDLGALGRVRINGFTGRVLEHTVVRDERLWGGPALATEAPRRPDGTVPAMYWANIGISPELRLSRIDAAYADHPYRHIEMSELPSDTRPSTLVRVDPSGPAIVDHWAFPPGRVCLSPQWVPGGEEGYLVTTMISDDSDTPGSSGCEVWVFDCANLAQGPLARLGHPSLDLPFTLHTAFTETAEPRMASYRVGVRTDTSSAVDRLSGEIQAMFESAVYPHFE